MRDRWLRGLASLTVLAWFTSGTQPMAVAWHVASEHRADAHGHHGPAPAGGGERVIHAHGAGHDPHAHALPEVVPGVRGDVRALVTAPLGPADSAWPLRDPVREPYRGVETPRAPDRPPPQVAAVRLL